MAELLRADLDRFRGGGGLNRSEPFGRGVGELDAPGEQGLIGHWESFEMCSSAPERHHMTQVC